MICPNCGSMKAYNASSCNICGYELGGSKRGGGQKIVIRSYSELFDHKKFGINFSIGIGYLIASMLAIFTWRIINGIMWHEWNFNQPLGYYIIIFVFNILAATLLVLISHGVNKEWASPVFFGLGMIVIGLVRRIGFSTIKIENMNFALPFDLYNIIFNFIWAFFFMVGLVLLVKFWGPHLWSFVLGMMLTFLAFEIINQIFDFARGFSIRFVNLIAPAIEGLIFGGFIYAGLALHLERKGYWLENGNLYSKQLVK